MKANSQPDPNNPAGPGGSNPWIAAVAVFMFLAWLFFPLAYRRLQPASNRISLSTREAVKLPSRDGRPLPDFLRDFSTYYERSNPSRKLLLSKFIAFKLYILGLSSVSSVIIGRNRWLFLGHESDKIDEGRYFTGTHPFDEKTLEKWLTALTQRRDWLERRGIPYWLVVAPNKSTIYPEYMPRLYHRGRSTRMDQLVEFLKQRAPGFPMVDLRPVLLAGKKARLLYWPLDTHWNDFGRDLAYREIIHQLAVRFPSLEALPMDAFEIRPCQETCHDLKKMLLLPWEIEGLFFGLVPRRPLPSSPVPAPNGSAADSIVDFHSKVGTIQHALVIHDSFGDTLKQLLSTHFRRSKWILDPNHPFPSTWIERMRPGLVIDEMVERFLDKDPWSNPAGIGTSL